MSLRSPRRSFVSWCAPLMALAVVAWLGGRGRGSEAWLGRWRLELFDGDGALALVLALSLALARAAALGPLAGGLVVLLAALGVWDLVHDPSLPAAWPRASGAALGVVAVLAVTHLRGAWRVASRPRHAALALSALLAGYACSLAVARIDHATWVRRLSAAAATSRTAPTHRDVLLIVVDTLRADAVAGLPFLDGLAARSLVLDDTLAAAPWTVPSVAALITGVYPARLDPQGRGRPWARPGDRPAQLVPAAAITLAERLARAGYVSAGLTKSAFVAPGTGFERGFDLFERVAGDTAERHSAGQLVDAALRWAAALASLRADGDGRPWFLSLHFMDPHVNYEPPAEHLSPRARAYDGPFDGRASTLHDAFREQRPPAGRDLEQLRDLYRGEVAYLDSQLARLFAELSGRGLLDDDTLVVFTADHGEQFGEHGGFLHGALYDENVAVPLWLSGAGLTPGRRAGPHSLVDLVPSVLDVLGLHGASELDGASALSAATERLVISDYGDERRLSGSHYTLLLSASGSARLFDRLVDPGETTNIAARHPELVAELRGLVEQHLARPALGGVDDGPPVELDLTTLRRLGYF